MGSLSFSQWGESLVSWSALTMVSLLLFQSGNADSATLLPAEQRAPKVVCPPEMVWVSGGQFTMGTDDSSSLQPILESNYRRTLASEAGN